MRVDLHEYTDDVTDYAVKKASAIFANEDALRVVSVMYLEKSYDNTITNAQNYSLFNLFRNMSNRV